MNVFLYCYGAHAITEPIPKPSHDFDLLARQIVLDLVAEQLASINMITETNLQILDALRQSLDVVLIALIYNFNQGHESQSILLLVSQSLQGELDAGEMICALDCQQKTTKEKSCQQYHKMSFHIALQFGVSKQRF